MGRFDILLPIILFGLGFIWCREMFPRWLEDWNTLTGQSGDYADKFATLVLWTTTMIIVFAMGLLVLMVSGSILNLFQ